MVTANELLASLTGSEEKVCVIDLDTRKINIPKSITVLGVEADDGVKRLYFRMPSSYRGTDLSTFSIRINYMNANNDEPYFATAKGVEINNNTINFYWEVERDVVAYKGDVKFIVCLRHSDTNGIVDRELNTTLATLPVLEGLETDMESIQVEPVDYLSQLFAVKDDYVEQITDTGDQYLSDLDTTHKTLDQKLHDTATIISNNFGPSLKTRANAIVNSSEGETISVNDASDDPLRDLRVFGKSTQIRTEGTQLWNNNDFVGPSTLCGVTLSHNNGTYTLNGTCDTSSNFFLGRISLKDGTYTLSANNPKNSGIALPNIQVYSPTTTKSLPCMDNTNYVVNTADLTAADDYELRIRIEAGVTYSGYTLKPVLNAGSVAYPWEPYSGGYASPSPEWQQEIVSVENPNVHICGKNLFDMSAINESNSVTKNSDGSISVTQYYNNSYRYLKELAPGLVVGKKYILYMNTDGSKFIYLSKYGGVWDHGYTFTMTEDMLNSTVAIYGANEQTSDTSITIRTIQIVLAGESLGYEPYRGTQTMSLTHTLPGIPVDSGGNYTDENGQQWICDEIDFERGMYIQRCYSETLTFTPQTELNCYSATLTYAANTTCAEGTGIPVLCPNLPYDPNCGSGSPMINGIRISATSPKCAIAYYNEEVIEELMVLYPLATPIETPLTEAELAAYSGLHSNYPTTTVMNDQGAHMEVKYNADTQTVLENTLRPTDAQVQAAVDAWLTAHFSSAEGVSF